MSELKNDFFEFLNDMEQDEVLDEDIEMQSVMGSEEDEDEEVEEEVEEYSSDADDEDEDCKKKKKKKKKPCGCGHGPVVNYPPCGPYHWRRCGKKAPMYDDLILGRLLRSLEKPAPYEPFDKWVKKNMPGIACGKVGYHDALYSLIGYVRNLTENTKRLSTNQWKVARTLAMVVEYWMDYYTVFLNQLDKEFKKIDDRLDGYDEQIEALKNEMAEIEEDLQNLHDAIDELNSALDATNKRVDTCESRLDTDEASIESIQESIRQQNATISVIQTTISQLSITMAQLQGEMGVLEEQESQQNSKIEALENQESQQNSKIEALEEDNSKLNADVDALEKLVESLTRTVEEQTTEIKNLEDKVEALELENSENSGDIESLESSVGELTDKYDEMEECCRDVQSDISALKEAVTTLQEVIDNIGSGEGGTVDLTGIQEEIDKLKEAVEELQNDEGVDLSEIQSEIESLQSAVNEIDLSAYYKSNSAVSFSVSKDTFYESVNDIVGNIRSYIDNSLNKNNTINILQLSNTKLNSSICIPIICYSHTDVLGTVTNISVGFGLYPDLSGYFIYNKCMDDDSICLNLPIPEGADLSNVFQWVSRTEYDAMSSHDDNITYFVDETN